MSRPDFRNQVALVTGAARNLGRGIAEALGRCGASVVVHHHDAQSATDAAAVTAAVEAAGGRAIAVAGDLSRPGEVSALFDAAERAFGVPRIVVHAAGTIVKKPFTAVTEADFDRSFGINAKGTFFVMQTAAKRIPDGGRIITVGTSLLAATTGFYAVYAGSKAPMEDFTRALAKEIGGRGVTVNTIAPGALDTPFFHGQEDERSTAYVKQMHPMGRLGTVDDVVPAVLFLASDDARWINGQTIFVNGGYVAR